MGRRRGLVGATLAVASGCVGLVGWAAPSASGAPVGACGFTTTVDSYQGAAGSTFMVVDLHPVAAGAHCTASVAATGMLVRQGGGTFPSTGPVSTSLAVRFGPGLPLPRVGLRWAGHCADPPGPGSLILTLSGHSVAQPVQATSCSAIGMPAGSLEINQLTTPGQVAIARTGSAGYDVVSEGGLVETFGPGGMSSPPGPNDQAATAVATTPAGTGGWVAGADGSVYTFGSAAFEGAATSAHPAAAVVGIAPAPAGDGYWLAGADGGVFSFGSAAFHGSVAAVPLAAPIVGIAATGDGGGYWLAGSDGGVFALGNAAFGGSAAGLALRAPIVGVAARPGGGYWLAGADGGIFAFGGAPFDGSAAALHLAAPIVGITATADGGGYWLLGADGGVFSFGDAVFSGSAT